MSVSLLDPLCSVAEHIPLKECDLCGEASFETIATRDRDGGELLTDLCMTCGLVSHHQIPTESELATFYARDYRIRYHGEWSPSARRVMRAWKNGERLLDQLCHCIPAGQTVLEIGAGIGCTVKVFQRAGYQASGIEPHEGFQHYARHRLRAPVRRATLADVDAPESLDAALMVHVIEHLRSPREALLKVHGMLRDGGHLYVECPNLAAPFAARQRLFHFAHIHNFTPLTLTHLAARCGFEVARCFSGPEEVNLQLLLRKVDGNVPIPHDCLQPQRTLANAFRYGPLRYSLRPTYLRRRARVLAGYLREHVMAEHFVARLVEGSSPRWPLSRTAVPKPKTLQITSPDQGQLTLTP